MNIYLMIVSVLTVMIVSKCKPEDVTLSTHDLYRLGSRSDILCLQDRSLAAFSLWRRCWRAGSWSTRSWCSWCCQLLLMAIQDACGIFTCKRGGSALKRCCCCRYSSQTCKTATSKAFKSIPYFKRSSQVKSF